MRLRTILLRLRQVRYLKFVMQHYGDSLTTGKYRVSDSLRSVVLDNRKIVEQSKKYFYKPGISTSKVKIATILNKAHIFKNTNTKSSEEYDALYTANNYSDIREVKLFSFKNNSILTICTTTEECEKQLRQYEAYSSIYRMPLVSKADRYPNSYAIAMVDLSPSPGEHEAMRAIAEATMRVGDEKGISGFVRVGDVINETYDDANALLLSKIISKADETLAKTAMPTCIQHGDLSKENLIYGVADGKRDYWFIDWEHAGERVFFYDWFFYIINTAMYYNDEALQLYLNGEEDELLVDLFERFNVSYEPKHRKDYLILFMLIFLKERVCDLGNGVALEQYCAFIDRYI